MELEKYKHLPQNKEGKKLYVTLEERGLIFAGSTISGKIVEEILGIHYVGNNDFHYTGPYLYVKMRLNLEGYFVTQKEKLAPGFKILSTEEMAEYALNKVHDNIMQNYHVACILGKHDISQLSEKDQKKHRNVQNKAMQAAMIQHKILMDEMIL